MMSHDHHDHEEEEDFEQPSEADMAAFMDMADKFVNLANDISKDTNPSKIAPAMLFAAARYCGFMWHNYGQHLHSREETVDYLVAQFETMLEDNITALAMADEGHKHGPGCGHDH
jgi:hypothetical protein